MGCPRVNEHRKVNALKGIDPGILPTSIINGIPPAMDVRAQGIYWGGPIPHELSEVDGVCVEGDDAPHIVDAAIKELIGAA